METKIKAEIDLADNQSQIAVPVPFFSHMINQLATHSGFGITLVAEGDVEVDPHHLIEDCGIALGRCLDDALGDRVGVRRFADALIPLDESLVQVALDLSGRGYYRGELGGNPAVGLGQPPVYLEHIEEFMRAFAFNAHMALHVAVIRDGNTHHQIEAAFKGLARCLREAASEFGGGVPSSKGSLRG
jgi:imidazoleglycerol-phosphate dehydratase